MIDRCDTAVEDCGREAWSKARPADWDADGPQGASVGAAGSTPRCVSVLGGVLLGGDLGGPPRPPLSSVERGASAIALDVHLYQRNIKLLFDACLTCDASGAGLYVHPKHRRRRYGPSVLSSKE